MVSAPRLLGLHGTEGCKSHTWPASYGSGGGAERLLVPHFDPPDFTQPLGCLTLWLQSEIHDLPGSTSAKKTLQAPTRIGKGGSLTLQGKGQGVASVHGSSVGLSKAPDFAPTPNTYTHVCTHTLTHSLALPSTLSSVEGGAFLELFRPEDLFLFNPPSPYTLTYNPALQTTGLAKKFVQNFP